MITVVYRPVEFVVCSFSSCGNIVSIAMVSMVVSMNSYLDGPCRIM